MARRLAAIVSLPVLVLASCTTSSDPAAISAAAATATFTGETCAADASSEFDVDSTVAFTVTNETDTDKALAVWKFPEAISDGGIFHAEPSRVGDAGYTIEVVDVPIKGDAHDLPHTFNESGGRP
jgi:hypothetical protein